MEPSLILSMDKVWTRCMDFNKMGYGQGVSEGKSKNLQTSIKTVLFEVFELQINRIRYRLFMDNMFFGYENLVSMKGYYRYLGFIINLSK